MADPLQPIDHRCRSTWETDRHSGLNQFCNLAVKSQQIRHLETLKSVVGRTGIRTHGNRSIRENQRNSSRAKARLATLVYLTDAPRTQIYSIDEKKFFSDVGFMITPNSRTEQTQLPGRNRRIVRRDPPMKKGLPSGSR